jgi:hypothetical protein
MAVRDIMVITTVNQAYCEVTVKTGASQARTGGRHAKRDCDKCVEKHAGVNDLKLWLEVTMKYLGNRKYGRSIITATAMLLILFASNAAALEQDSDSNGGIVEGKRYKIFTAEHQAIARNGSVVTIRSIFKIDLETGTVWRYRQGVDQKGKRYEEFFEVPNQ